MDGLGAGAARRLEDAPRVEVALGRRRTAEQEGLVRVRNVPRRAVGLRVDRDRPDPELAQRPEDANRDLAAVRHENLAEHPTYSPCE